MNAVKSQPPEPAGTASEISGKVVIIGVLVVAIAGAAASWIFRYNATHEAAAFWGADPARIIRDAPAIELLKLAPGTTSDSPVKEKEIELLGERYAIAARIDVSSAHGMTHLRNALLEDRSFDSFNLVFEPAPHRWRWALCFRDGQQSATILFLENCIAACLADSGKAANCQPIADGLTTMFAEFVSDANTAR